MGHVEGALPALGERRAGGGNDHGAGHGRLLSWEVVGRTSGVAEQLVIELDQLDVVGGRDALVGAVEARQVLGLGAHRRELVDVVGDGVEVARVGGADHQARRDDRRPGCSSRTRAVDRAGSPARRSARPATPRRTPGAALDLDRRVGDRLRRRARTTASLRVARQQAEVDQSPSARPGSTFSLLPALTIVSAVVVRSIALVLGAFFELRCDQRPEQPQVRQQRRGSGRSSRAPASRTSRARRRWMPRRHLRRSRAAPAPRSACRSPTCRRRRRHRRMARRARSRVSCDREVALLGDADQRRRRCRGRAARPR